MIVTYKAGSAEERKKLGEKITYLDKKYPGQEYVIEIVKNHPIRSLDQNAYYWFCLKIISNESGIDKDKLHGMMALKFNTTIIEFKNGLKESSPMSTKDLKKDEFALYTNKVKDWAKAFLNVQIPDRRDAVYSQWMEVNQQYDRTFHAS